MVPAPLLKPFAYLAVSEQNKLDERTCLLSGGESSRERLSFKKSHGFVARLVSSVANKRTRRSLARRALSTVCRSVWEGGGGEKGEFPSTRMELT